MLSNTSPFLNIISPQISPFPSPLPQKKKKRKVFGAGFNRFLHRIYPIPKCVPLCLSAGLGFLCIPAVRKLAELWVCRIPPKTTKDSGFRVSDFTFHCHSQICKSIKGKQPTSDLISWSWFLQIREGHRRASCYFIQTLLLGYHKGCFACSL